MIANVALVVGNGFTLDCFSQLLLEGIDPRSPIDWPIVVPNESPIAVRDALPNFFAEFDRLRGDQPAASQFELFRQIVAGSQQDSLHAEVETRHFLSLAYRFLSDELAAQPLEHWRWVHWLRAYSHVIVTSVSFNYDCLLERVLTLIGRQYHRRHNIERHILHVFKPHGSAEFDLDGLVRGQLSYPLRFFGRMNNMPLRIISAEDWHSAPAEPLIVVPFEANPYESYQWAAPGYTRFARIGPHLTHCVLAGLSYHAADRREIDHFIFSTPISCKVIVANPTPCPDLLRAIEASGRELHLWKDGPEPLPF